MNQVQRKFVVFDHLAPCWEILESVLKLKCFTIVKFVEVEVDYRQDGGFGRAE